MKLYEKEAKKLLENRGLKTPPSSGENLVVKAQVLSNHRKEKGGIKFAENRENAEQMADKMENMVIDGQEVNSTLIESQIDFTEEYYVAFMYDTETRNPIMLFSAEGGTGIEDRNVSKLVLEDDSQFRFREFLIEQGFNGKEILKLGSFLQKLFQAFLEEDARMLEVNPLVKSDEGYVILDAMIDLEDDASYRHNWNFPERNAEGGEKTEREIRAEKIDENDHRGVAGKYTELEGNIGMMLAGGGASLTNMDALIEYGGNPANYTEYGGNPPTEKVYKLSKVIMSKDIDGLWHVGGTANNTDVERTMDGFIQALREVKPEYPIVVRRDGPHADEAFEKLREVKEDLNLNMKLFRNDKPMTESAKNLMKLVDEYREVQN